jgi:hypothetical protein
MEKNLKKHVGICEREIRVRAKRVPVVTGSFF